MEESDIDKAMISNELKRRLRTDRRIELRHTLALPVHVTGVDGNKEQRDELVKALNVSSGGMAVRLSKKVLVGDTIFIEVPLPARFRKNAERSPTYNTYAVVRYIETRQDGKQIVRLKFV